MSMSRSLKGVLKGVLRGVAKGVLRGVIRGSHSNSGVAGEAPTWVGRRGCPELPSAALSLSKVPCPPRPLGQSHPLQSVYAVIAVHLLQGSHGPALRLAVSVDYSSVDACFDCILFKPFCFYSFLIEANMPQGAVVCETDSSAL